MSQTLPPVVPPDAPAIASPREPLSQRPPAVPSDAPSTNGRAPADRLAPRVRFRTEERREFRYHLSVAIAIAFSWLFAVMAAPLRNWIADRGGDLFHRLSRTYRENVLANVGQAMGPDAPPAAVAAAARSVFRISARNFVDLIRLPRTPRRDFVDSITLVGGSWGLLDDALAQGRGVILMTAHLGAFDHVGHTISMRGYPLTTVTGRTTSRFVFDGVTYLRRSHGAVMVEATPSGIRRVIQALRRGECAALVADYDLFQNGRPVTFFGKETTLPPGPIRIARDTGALVVGTFARRTADGYALSFEEPFAVEKTADLDADLEQGMNRAARMLERAIGASPDQWVMFQRVWPSAPAEPVRVFPVGSPLESELLRRVDDVLPAPRTGTAAAPPDPPTL